MASALAAIASRSISLSPGCCSANNASRRPAGKADERLRPHDGRLACPEFHGDAVHAVHARARHQSEIHPICRVLRQFLLPSPIRCEPFRWLSPTNSQKLRVPSVRTQRVLNHTTAPLTDRISAVGREEWQGVPDGSRRTSAPSMGQSSFFRHGTFATSSMSMHTESASTPTPAFPVTDEVRHALAVAKRGADELLIEAEFAQKLAKSAATGKPLRIKLGLDPTAPDIPYRPHRRVETRCVNCRISAIR